MKKIKLAVATILLGAGAFGAYAFSTNSENNQAVSSPTEYWVTAKNPDNSFSVSPTQPPGKDCAGGSDPCYIITTETPEAGRLSQEQMYNENTTILDEQNL